MREGSYSMDTGTQVATVPFKITVWSASAYSEAPPSLEAYHAALDEYFFGNQQADSFLVNGWVMYKTECDKNVEFQDLLVYALHKGPHLVYELNESDSDEEIVETFFAENREALEEFCRDWGFDPFGIEASRPVRQTL